MNPNMNFGMPPGSNMPPMGGNPMMMNRGMPPGMGPPNPMMGGQMRPNQMMGGPPMAMGNRPMPNPQMMATDPRFAGLPPGRPPGPGGPPYLGMMSNNTLLPGQQMQMAQNNMGMRFGPPMQQPMRFPPQGMPRMNMAPLQGFGPLGLQPGFRLGVPMGMMRPNNPGTSLQPTEKEIALVDSIIKKDINLTFQLLKDYHNSKSRNKFWQRLTQNGQPFVNLIMDTVEDAYQPILLGIFFGGEYYDAALLRYGIQKDYGHMVLVGLLVMKNIKHRIPNDVYNTLYKNSIKQSLTDWKNESASYCIKIIDMLRRKSDNVSKETNKEDAIRLFKNIEGDNMDDLYKFFLVYSKERILQTANAFYESFGMSVAEFAENKCIHNDFVEIIRQTISVKVGTSNYMAFLLWQATKSEEKDQLFPYLIMTARKLNKRKIAESFKTMTYRQVTDKVKEIIPDPVGSYLAKRF